MAQEKSFQEIANFHPKQLEAMAAVKAKTYILYGGAMGGGKSYFLRWMAVYLLMYYSARYNLKGVRVGIFCEDYPALKERHLSKVPFEFPEWLGTLNKSEHEFVLNERYGGGTIAFRNLDDVSKYLSSEFASILVDELTKNSNETFNFLNMRRRWPGIPDTKFIGATNPGSQGHVWTKKLWIDKDFAGEEYDPDDFAFIQAKFSDNPSLPANYDKILATLPEKLRRAYRDGDWDIFDGQYFSEWNRKDHVVEPFQIPDGWQRIRCLDYGMKMPSAVYWLAINYDGDVFVYRELWQTQLTYPELAKRVLEMTPENEKIDYTVADTSIFAQTLDSRRTGDELMALEGLDDVIPADKERVHGWNVMRIYLRENKLKVFNTCKELIRTLPALVHSETKPEDVKKCDIDHGAESLRYGLVSLGDPPEMAGMIRKDENNGYLDDKDAPWNKSNKVSYSKIYSNRKQ